YFAYYYKPDKYDGHIPWPRLCRLVRRGIVLRRRLAWRYGVFETAYSRPLASVMYATLTYICMFKILVEDQAYHFYHDAVRRLAVGFRDIVARNVRRLRLRNRWTQQQLAERLERHKQTV